MPERNSNRDYDLMIHDGLELDIDLNEEDEDEDEDEESLSSDEPEEELPVIADAWIVQPVTVPSDRNSQYCSRRRQHEFEATRHDSCRCA